MSDPAQVHPRSGKPAEPGDLVDVPKLVTAYYTEHPDPHVDDERVSFGTSGHRGSSLKRTFNEDHILAVSQAICDYRAEQGIDGPLFLAGDTHALSEPATISALEVFAANGITLLLDQRGGYTPTPAVSRAILTYNRGRSTGLADGVLLTPSHNPPEDGGIKYNPPTGGPAGSEVTGPIQDRANAHLEGGLKEIKRVTHARAREMGCLGSYDFLGAYVEDLALVLDLEAVRAAGVRIGADPLGGASVAYWGEIADRYGLDLTVVNTLVDPTWRFMTLDWDGKIRMDCSSPHAMASLIARRAEYQVATGNDADADRHGIITPEAGLMNPNHYLTVAIDYLYRQRSGWPSNAAVGKTLVSSSMIDRVAADLGRPLSEMPVGFKWFANGLGDGTIAFGAEESAGASFLCRDGSAWTTDKDGIILALLASEITAVTGQSPGERYAELVNRFGNPAYARVDAPASPAEKAALASFSPDQVTAQTLAGEPIKAKLTKAPANGAPIGGIKLITDTGWFAARPSGTEAVYKVYAESFLGPENLATIQKEGQEILGSVLRQ